MPASTWMAPPYASATPKTIGSPAAGNRPALNRLNRNVVSAKQPRPSGAGSAIIRTFSEASSLATAIRPAVGSPRSARNSVLASAVRSPAGGCALTVTARPLLIDAGSGSAGVGSEQLRHSGTTSVFSESMNRRGNHRWRLLSRPLIRRGGDSHAVRRPAGPGQLAALLGPFSWGGHS